MSTSTRKDHELLERCKTFNSMLILFVSIYHGSNLCSLSSDSPFKTPCVKLPLFTVPIKDAIQAQNN